MAIEHADGFLIGFDLGTTAMKGVVTDAAGNELASAEALMQYSYPRESWVEADPEQFRASVFRLLRELTASVPGPVRAVAFSGATGNTLLCNQDGKPLTNIISWLDRRNEDRLPQTLRDLTVEHMRQVTGWPCIDRFPIGHLAWLQENRPELYARAGRVCMNNDWLQFQMTGVWQLDHSTATTGLLQNQEAGRYHQPFLDRLGLREAQLSPLSPSGSVVGPVTPEVAAQTGLSPETLVVTGCFDHPSAARGVGVTEPGQLLLSCGTSWVGLFPENDRTRLVNAAVLCDPFLSDQGGPWAGMFSVSEIGRRIDAYVRECIAPGESQPYVVFNAAAEACDCSGLEIDLREPVCDPGVGRERLARAVMEGAARLLNEKIEEQRKNGFTFDDAVMVGGPSRSAVWRRIIEDMIGLPVRVGSAHSGACGTAMLAGSGSVPG